MTTDNDDEPLEGLGDDGLKLWQEMHATFDFTEEPHKLKTLERACRTADTIAVLEAEAANSPLIVHGSMKQPVISPLISEARSQTTVLNTLLKSLGLPDSDEEATERAARRSRAGKTAARARWGSRGGGAV